MTMSPETVTQLRRRLAAFFLCFGLIAVHQPGSTRAQSDDVIADPESYAVFAAAFTIGIADSGRPADRVALLGETRAVTTCPDEKAVPPEWRPVVASHTKENASIRTLRPDADLGRPYSLVSRYCHEYQQLMLEKHEGK